MSSSPAISKTVAISKINYPFHNKVFSNIEAWRHQLFQCLRLHLQHHPEQVSHVHTQKEEADAFGKKTGLRAAVNDDAATITMHGATMIPTRIFLSHT